MRAALRQTRRTVNNGIHLLQDPRSAILRPTRPILYTARRADPPLSLKNFSTCIRARQEATVDPSPDNPETQPALNQTPNLPTIKRKLPRSCPGCGAPSQIYDSAEAGYYNINKNAVKGYLEFDPNNHEPEKKADDVYTQALKRADPKLLEEIGLSEAVLEAGDPVEQSAPETPVCDRCHNLVHHRVGTPIFHPSVEAIQQIIAESPHRRNHIYHVVDAADFPLSLIPSLQTALRIPKLRTQNRRAKHKGWVANDRIAEVSFIITRSDLLAPTKEQVDSLMPYIQEVLRDALGRVNKLARLGNVRLVSAKRGWWTTQIKEDIWDRGGASWMVGKVNVGKSNLFEVVFPKGRDADFVDIAKVRRDNEATTQFPPNYHSHNEFQETTEENEEDYDTDALLPPPQPWLPYPVLPIASSLPGTTASPIRIPFGRNRGELIDLPGLARTVPGLETFVVPSAQDDLIMKSRIKAQRYVLKPGQSLILGGGLIRLTPTTENLVFQIHSFVPIGPHITRTDKAIDYQAQTSERTLASILAPDVGSKMRSAGRFKLEWDSTKKLTGPLSSPVAGKMRPENLPFRVFCADILIEGVGWLEVSAQVRRPRGWKAPGMVKKNPNHAREAKLLMREREKEEMRAKYEASLRGEPYFPSRADDYDYEDDTDFPEIEVFSPLGKFVGVRKPMCASAFIARPVSSRDRKTRPRRSMRSVKNQRKPLDKA